MKNMWKFKVAKKDEIIASVASTGSVSSTGIANGRMVPVVMLQSDEGKIIETAIKAHMGIENGSCQSQWGCTTDGNTIILSLEISSPVAVKIMIPLDIIEKGATVDQIIHTQCLWLMTGEPGMRLSENLNKERILLEIPSREFASEWRRIYKKKYCNHLRKTYKMSHKAAEEVFEKLQEEFSCVKKMRMK